MAQLTHSLKILQVIDRLDAGGAERVMVDLSNILCRNGHLVTTIAILDHGLLGNDLDKNITKVDLRRTSRFSFRPMRTLSRQAKNHDILHVHMRHNLKYVWLVKMLFPFKAKIIFHDHYGKINVDRTVPVSLKWAMGKAIYIGVSKQLADWAREKAGLPWDQVFYLSNIIIRKDLNTPSVPESEGIRLVMVSNIRKEKNIEFAIKIAKKLSENGEANLTIYGQIVDRGYYDQLKGTIEGLGITDRVSFVHDCMDIQPELHRYNLAIHTAKSETGPLVLIEYLCQGLPFISFRTGEVIDQLKEEIPDFITDNFEADAWIQRIRHIQSMNNREELVKLYRKYYSAENYYRRCMKIYEKSLTC